MARQEVLELLTRYLNAYKELKVALDQLTEEQLLIHPEPGKWCIKEIVFHITDTEIIATGRMKRIIAEDNPQLIAFDQDKFAASLFYTELDMRPALLIFGLLRETMSKIFEKLSDDAWNRKGIHSVRGETTLLDTLKHIAQHSENHIAQIITIRKKLTA